MVEASTAHQLLQEGARGWGDAGTRPWLPPSVWPFLMGSPGPPAQASRHIHKVGLCPQTSAGTARILVPETRDAMGVTEKAAWRKGKPVPPNVPEKEVDAWLPAASGPHSDLWVCCTRASNLSLEAPQQAVLCQVRAVPPNTTDACAVLPQSTPRPVTVHPFGTRQRTGERCLL